MKKYLKKAYISLTGSAGHSHTDLSNFHLQDWAAGEKSLV